MNKLISGMILLFTSLLLSFSLSSPSSPTIHDVLRSKGLPAGLLPQEVDSYTLHDDGRLEVFLAAPCLAEFETRVYFDTVVRGNLSYGSLVGVEGLSQLELFLWLSVKDIVVKNPDSGVIIFDIGVAFKQLSLSLFEDPPKCKPSQGYRVAVWFKASAATTQFKASAAAAQFEASAVEDSITSSPSVSKLEDSSPPLSILAGTRNTSPDLVMSSLKPSLRRIVTSVSLMRVIIISIFRITILKKGFFNKISIPLFLLGLS